MFKFLKQVSDYAKATVQAVQHIRQEIATNRPEILDPALLRPGRARQVLVDRLALAGREAILKIHAQKVKLGEDVNLGAIA